MSDMSLISFVNEGNSDVGEQPNSESEILAYCLLLLLLPTAYCLLPYSPTPVPHHLPLLVVGEEARRADPRPQRLALGRQPLDLVGVVPEPQSLAESGASQADSSLAVRATSGSTVMR